MPDRKPYPMPIFVSLVLLIISCAILAVSISPKVTAPTHLQPWRKVARGLDAIHDPQTGVTCYIGGADISCIQP